MFVNFSMEMQNITFWASKTKILLFIILGLFLIFLIYETCHKIFNDHCYQKCSEYHLLGEASAWNYNDFVIDNGDTIWVDKQCYNDWCICIDECNPGLCCELLR